MSALFHQLPPMPARRFRRKVHANEVTTVWNDGAFTKVNCFGEVEERQTLPVDNGEPAMRELFAVIDGLCPARIAIVLHDPECAEVSL